MTGKTPSNNYRTFVLLLLTLVYGFNFIDRQIMGILAPFIQADLGLTNTQLGLLIGLAFAAFYTIMGIPIAILADKFNRVKLLSAALALWSGFTALTGFTNNFLQIGLARMGVGVGEAGGSPPSHSIISDMYPKEKRAGALGIYSLGIPLGIMSAYFITASLLGADPSTVSWRKIFFVLGISGIALALVVLIFIKEPARGAADVQNTAEVKKIPFGDALGILLKIPSWWFMAFGIALASFAAYAFSGFQTKFLVQLDPELNLKRTLIWIGIINGTFYALGTYLGAKAVDKRAQKDVRAYGYIPALCILLALPLGVASFWAGSVNQHLMFAAPFQFLIGVYLGPSFAIAQTLAPIHIRAMSTALFFFILNMIALGGGPTIAGILIDVFAVEHGGLGGTRRAMTVAILAFIPAIASYMMVARTLPKDWADAEARNSGAAE